MQLFEHGAQPGAVIVVFVGDEHSIDAIGVFADAFQPLREVFAAEPGIY
jgi:hypothetical protein